MLDLLALGGLVGRGASSASRGTEAAFSWRSVFRTVNSDHPPLAAVVAAMQAAHPENYDCNEIAEDLREAAGGKGNIIHVSNGSIGVLTPEGAGLESYTYHEVYTDGRYVYDPRIGISAVAKGDWMRLMRGLNPSARFTIR